MVCTALHADYLALIEKENWQALNEIKEATSQAEALVAKHPDFKDAYLSMGVENYLLSQKVGPVRMFLRLTGAQTDKEVGLQKLQNCRGPRPLFQAICQNSAGDRRAA